MAHKVSGSCLQFISAAAEEWDPVFEAVYCHPAVGAKFSTGSSADTLVAAVGRGAHMCGMAALFFSRSMDFEI